MTQEKGFLRLNHFHGLRLETEDFQVGERYHIEKKRLHNRAFHSPGVVPGYLGELKVVGRRRNDFSIEVAPGYALDGDGNDIFLWETEVKVIDPGKMKLPCAAFVVVKSVEEPCEFVVNKANPKFQGHKRVLEKSKVEVMTTEPQGPKDGVELARIQIAETTTEIRDAADAENPQAGEIDLRYVPRAGMAGSFLTRSLIVALKQALKTSRQLFGELAKRLDLGSARDARQAIITLEMLLKSNLVNFVTDAADGMKVVASLQEECSEEVRMRHPELAGHADFLNFEEGVKNLLKLLEVPDGKPEAFQNVLRSQEKVLSSLTAVVEGTPKEPIAPKAVEARAEAPEAAAEAAPTTGPEPGARVLSWAEMQELGAGFPPEKIFLEGKNYRLVDQIDFGSPTSRTEHAFQIVEAREQSRARRKLTYPDATALEASGVYHTGGYSQWTVKGLAPGRDVILAKRIDFSRGELVTDISVDGNKIGAWEIRGSDQRNPWRNWLFRVPGASIGRDSITVRQMANEAERDVNMFGLWFFQATT